MRIDVNKLRKIHNDVIRDFSLWTMQHLFEVDPDELSDTFVSFYNKALAQMGIENFALPYKGKYPKLLKFDDKKKILKFGTEDYKITSSLKSSAVELFDKWNNMVESQNNSGVRGFKWIKDFPTNIFELPKRSTSKSAGYDIYVIHPKVFEIIENSLVKTPDINKIWNTIVENNDQIVKCNKNGVIVLPTGLKAYMQNDEFLMMTIRSSSSIKNGIQQANSPSVIDTDYFENKDNDGHIYFAIRNKEFKFDKPIVRIAQGIFMKYLVADDDNAKNIRIGGIGSTGDK